MSTEFMQTLVARCVKVGLVKPDEVEGFSDSEIQEMEKMAGNSFPGAYKNFLSVTGRRFGKISRSEAIFLPNAQAFLALQKFPVELFAESSLTFRLPTKAIVISQHDGYQFMYFETGSGDDPPIFMFVEANDEAVLVANSLSTHIASILWEYQRKIPARWEPK